MLPVPTRRLAVVALVAVVAIVAADTKAAFWLVNGLLAVLVVVDWALAPRVSRLEVQREVPEAVPLGGEVSLMWRVRNPTGRKLRVVVSDELAPSLRPRRRSFEATVPPRSSVTASTVLQPVRRGRFDPHGVAVRVHGPLGLAARQGTMVVPSRLRVLPSFSSRDQAELRIDHARILEVGLRSAKGRGGGTEFDQLREYTPDDEFRKIDWAATARQGKAIVRSYRAERNQTVVNLLDNGRVMAGRVGGVPRVEHAMDAVMMVTYLASRLGDRSGLVAFDRTVRAVVKPGHGPAQLTRVTEALYDLAPVLAESDYGGAFTTTLARFRRRSLLVIHTDLVEQAVVESLLPALPVITRNHLVIVAAVQDPDVAAWALAGAGVDGGRSSEGTFAQASAIATLDERRRTIGLLRRLGVTVVDAPPGELAAELADAYLQVKATGRL